jgi:competence protein ComEC
MMNRSHLPLNAWSQALFLMLLFNPWNLFDVGMQMSFMAVLGILVYNVPLQHLLSFQNKILRFLWGTIAISLSAQIGVAPLIAFYFHRFSTLFVMTNFVVIPLTTVILYMVVISFMFVWWPFFHSLLLNIISNLGHLMNSFVEWEASLPVASIDHINLSVLQVFCIYVFIIAGSLFLSKISTLRKLIQLSNSYSSFEYDD